jgi:hypothetical protein
MANGTGKPNKPLERTTGIGAVVLTPLWIFIIAIHVIDWISRGQTMMALDPYIHYLVTPWAEIGEFILAVGLLFYATRLEHFREADEAPRIILAYTEPVKLKRHWFWLKWGIGSAILSLIVAISLVFWLHHTHRNVQVAVTQSKDSSASSSVPASIQQPRPRKGGGPSRGGRDYLTGSDLTIGYAYYLNGSTLALADAYGLNATATFTSSSASIAAANGLYAGAPVQFTTTGTLPTNFNTGTTYYVILTGLSSSTFEVSARVGGAAISAGSAGSGTQTVTKVLTLPAVCVASSSTRCIYSGIISTGTWKAGGELYLSDSTPGALTQTLPSASGHALQVMGFAMSTTEILVKMSSDWGSIQ